MHVSASALAPVGWDVRGSLFPLLCCTRLHGHRCTLFLCLCLCMFLLCLLGVYVWLLLRLPCRLHLAGFLHVLPSAEAL